MGAKATGEADKVYQFFTREFGMIYAHATSVRLSKSKLRGHIIQGALLSITLVRSKLRFRLTEVVVIRKLLSRSDEYLTLMKIISILKTLIQGEERNESLFESLFSGFNYLVTERCTDLKSFECLMMLKIMHALGYGEPKSSKHYEQADFSQEVLEEVSKDRIELVGGINKALEATGLR